MSWVKEALVNLQKGNNAKVRPHGGSMKGRIESGQLVTLAPTTFDEVEEDDAVLIKWKGNYLLHLVKEKVDDQILIGNNPGHF